MRLSAWRMRDPRRRRSPAAAPDRPTPRRPARQDSRPETADFFTEDVAYHRALEWRFATGSFNAPGPAPAWTRPSASWSRASR